LWVGLVVGMVFGVFGGLLYVLVMVMFNVDYIVFGVVINLFVVGVVKYLLGLVFIGYLGGGKI